jgi:transcription antitermination factor NusA-like protein
VDKYNYILNNIYMAKANDLLLQHLEKIATEYGTSREKIKEGMVEVFQELLQHRYSKQNTIVKWEGNELVVFYERNGEFFPIKNEFIKPDILAKILPRLRRKLQQGKSAALFEHFKGREGELFLCTIRGISQFGINIEVENHRGLISHMDKIPGEEYTNGQTVLCLMKRLDDTRNENTAYFTRRGIAFMEAILKRNIPDINRGVIEIFKIARIDGRLTKVVVRSNIASINVIGACMGPENIYRNQIMQDLGHCGEKLVFVEYSQDPKEYLMNSLGYKKHLIDVDIRNNVADVCCDPESINLIIGRGGCNVRIAVYLQGGLTQITSINVHNPTQYQNKLDEARKNDQLKYRENFLKFCGNIAEELTEDFDVFLGGVSGVPSGREIAKVDGELGQKLREYNKYLKQQEFNEFYEAGGSKEFVNSLSDIPVNVLWRLKQQEINSIDDILNIGSPQGLAAKCSLPQDVAMLIFNSAENVKK